ncbi:MAG: hypothetical protein ABSH14_14470 [Verrucomicrobiia bacterium]|jgi:hypothetical protein
MKKHAKQEAETAKAPVKPTDGNPYPPKRLRGVIYAEGSKGFKTEAALFDRVAAITTRPKDGIEKATREQIARCYRVVSDPKNRFNLGSKVEKQGDTMTIVAK